MVRTVRQLGSVILGARLWEWLPVSAAHRARQVAPKPTHAEPDEPRLDHDRDGEVAHSWGRRLAQGRTFHPWTAPATERPGFRERGNGHRRNLTALRRTPVSIWNDDVSDWAASLTYYSVLSIFPALLVTVSLVGLTGAATVRDLISNVNAVVPAESRAVIENALNDMADRQTATWLVVGFGAAGALWSASSYLAVFRRALHAMHGVEDRRPVWRTAPRNVITALVLLGLFVSSAGALMLTGELARTAGRVMGMSEAADTTWAIAKWPLLLLLTAVLVWVLFHTGPAQARGLAQRALGGALAVVLWLIASVGFALYASLVGTYSRLYGSLTGIVVFFVWLWVSNLALLTGAQFNAELVKLQNGER